MLHLGPLCWTVVTALGQPSFQDVTDSVGLGPEAVPETVARLCFADLDGDDWPDVVIDRHRVFLNTADPASPIGRRFHEVAETGLPAPDRSTAAVFADLDDDGRLDAIVTEFVDTLNDQWTDHGRRTGWHPGRGDGTFGPRRELPCPPRTTISVAVGEVNHDGTLDLYLGNTYRLYGGGYEGYADDLLLSDGSGQWTRHPLPEDAEPFDAERDAGGRPTFGTLVVSGLPERAAPALLALGYGRRWNRLWVGDPATGWRDVAPEFALDGDGVRHGRYPAWLAERAKTDPRFEREDEPPFRANGNTFDAAVGDVDNDGDLDMLISEITHGWAGESSDRTRVLLQERTDDGRGRFEPSPRIDLDRIPPDVNNWNQGDLFCALADLDHDGRLDVVVSSGDYPDDQRLRVYLQTEEGSVEDATAALGLDHDGSQQISLGDVDGDGDLDLLVGQTFNRYPKEQRAGRSPRPRLFVNRATEGRGSIMIHLAGDGERVSRNALGAVVRGTLPDGSTLGRSLVGIGGHAGKQDDFVVHLGLGDATRLDTLTVQWPDRARTVQRFRDVDAGRYTLAYGGELVAGRPQPRTSRAGYAGLGLRDIPGGHTVVSRVLPGPLDGDGLASSSLDLARPDLVVSVDGEAMDAETFHRYVADAAEGSTIRLAYRRSRHRGSTIPDALDHETDVVTLDVEVSSRSTWTGTIDDGRGHDTEVAFAPPRLLDPADRTNTLGAAVAEHGLAGPIDRLEGVFATWQSRHDDYHSLSRVRAGFDDPFRLAELEQLVTDPTHAVPRDPFAAAVTLLAENLDAPPPTSLPTNIPADADAAVAPDLPARMIVAVERSSAIMDEALGTRAGDEALAAKCLALLRVPRETFYLQGDQTREHVEVIRRSIGVRFDLLGPALAAAGELSAVTAEDAEDLEPVPVPPALAGAVEGEILAARRSAAGWVVVGGAGENRFDLGFASDVDADFDADPDRAPIAAVVDVGGDDVYEGGHRPGVKIIVDLAGDDRYTGEEVGPTGALLGLTLVDDRSGGDLYEGGLLGVGAAMYGVSLLLDRAGHDVYAGREWSIGAGCYGAGMVFDLGNGGDSYLGDFLCQGVGGPRGFGCIVDEGGRDLYRANGPTRSAYGTPAVYQSFSQGMGFGFRHYTAGGIGLISDLGGDDRYEAGEFGQGGAYFFGLGILHDASGRDVYYGNRYGQGFGVHQALGVLADDAGDDTYWSMTAASQGAAWDVGVGLLVDREGDDSYQCDGLGQGAASMQAIGMLVDLDGRDRYVARAGATQGQSGSDQYHYHETRAHSFSVLLDLGDDADHYSRGRPNGRSVVTGDAAPDDPQRSTVYGLCIDQ